MESQCTIQYQNNTPYLGVCNPDLYAVPYKGTGYDPNWISCSYVPVATENQGQIYCFTPNQGNGNSIPVASEKALGVSTSTAPVTLPKSLPNAGINIWNTFLISFLLTAIIIGVFIAAKKGFDWLY